MATIELTPSQKELAHLFFSTQVPGKVRRREKFADGSYLLTEIQRNTGVIEFSNNDQEFALASHLKNPTMPLSPYYFNFRNLPESLATKIAKELSYIADGTKFDYCVGVPNAAADIAQNLGKIVRRPALPILRKDDGEILANRMQFPIGNFNRLLVVEDVFSSGSSAIDAAKAVEGIGWKVAGIVGVVERGQGGIEMIESSGYMPRTIFNFRDLLEEYRQTGLISRSQYLKSRVYMGMQKSNVCRF